MAGLGAKSTAPQSGESVPDLSVVSTAVLRAELTKRHRYADVLKGDVKSVEYLLRTFGDAIPVHVAIWMREFIAEWSGVGGTDGRED